MTNEQTAYKPTAIEMKRLNEILLKFGLIIKKPNPISKSKTYFIRHKVI